MITQPENLPKDRLKAELKKRGIPFSPAKNKDYYVKLYQEKVAKPASGTRQRSEFSSDEETSRRQLVSSQRRQYSKSFSVEHFLGQIESYSDSQLISELQKYGIPAGPITATTRSLYQKKLARVMFEKSKEPVSKSSSGVVTIASESDDDLSSDNEVKQADPVVGAKPVPSRKPPVSVAPASPSASSYNLRSRSQPLQASQSKLIPRGVAVDARPSKTGSTHAHVSTAPVRPYSATWCRISVFVNLLVLVVVFLVAIVAFDYFLYGRTRLVDWILLKYPFLANITGLK